MYSVPSTHVKHRINCSPAQAQWKIIRYCFKTGLKSGPLLGGIYGTFFFPVIGTIVGAIIGVIAGAVLGLIVGLALGSVTSAWFYPVTQLDAYRRVMTLLTSATILLGGLFLIVFVAVPNRFNRSSNLLEVVDETKFLILFPTLIAALCPLFWRNRYIRWYIANL